ncbi:hypothetical protein LOAG_16628 [Loa loa]|uniref:Maltoporin n=1 Tax=Loa loa TaxID=7209 RepID=A0A1I7VQ93_LOALO|nr:hypothetical protein LOAG_16628 [Loa loa]EJD76390.1 hypothetical protein LOAG_16628 [Loa loa]
MIRTFVVNGDGLDKAGHEHGGWKSWKSGTGGGNWDSWKSNEKPINAKAEAYASASIDP